MKPEIITLNAPAGTRKRLAEIRRKSGLTNEDIFKFGLRYVFLRERHLKSVSARNGSIVE